MHLGKKLKQQRTLLKLSQDDVVESIGVTRPTISNWETSRTVPDILNIAKLSVLYGCSLDTLLAEEVYVMTKTFKTITYNSKVPLKIDTGKNRFFPDGVEIKANVNMETGEVTFFIEQEDLQKLNVTK